MKKYLDGDYVNLSEKEIVELEETKQEKAESVGKTSDMSNISNAITKTVTGKAIIIKDLSPFTEYVRVDLKGQGRVFVTGINVITTTYEPDGTRISCFPFRVMPGVDYYLYCRTPVYDFETTHPLFDAIVFYDRNENEVGRQQNVPRDSIITTPDNCEKMRFILCEESKGSVTFEDICINVSNSEVNGMYARSSQEVDFPVYVDNSTSSLYTVINYEILRGATIQTSDWPEDLAAPVLECTYSKDINGVIGDIGTALDNIIAIQNSLMEVSE